MFWSQACWATSNIDSGETVRKKPYTKQNAINISKFYTKTANIWYRHFALSKAIQNFVYQKVGAKIAHAIDSRQFVKGTKTVIFIVPKLVHNSVTFSSFFLYFSFQTKHERGLKIPLITKYTLFFLQELLCKKVKTSVKFLQKLLRTHYNMSVNISILKNMYLW